MKLVLIEFRKVITSMCMSRGLMMSQKVRYVMGHFDVFGDRDLD